MVRVCDLDGTDDAESKKTLGVLKQLEEVVEHILRTPPWKEHGLHDDDDILERFHDNCDRDRMQCWHAEWDDDDYAKNRDG